ncbi:MAG: hypothetical protein HFF01_09420 [Erysipelotrichaceae bacterium]|nr:hypothetical protein [Erysipelotrichaceae bacterium]
MRRITQMIDTHYPDNIVFSRYEKGRFILLVLLCHEMDIMDRNNHSNTDSLLSNLAHKDQTHISL